MMTLELPARLDTPAADALIASLEARRGHDLTLSGAAVETLGGRCLEALLVARACWAREGLRFTVSNASGPFLGALALLGALDFGLLAEGEA